MKRDAFLPGLFLLIFLLGVASLAIALPAGPEVQPASALPEEFSAERAYRHIEVIGQQPHPVSTAAHDRVRDYIIDQLQTLGFDPQVQRTTSVYARYSVAANVENVYARLPGKGKRPAILLIGHYDSVPNSYGANDDGAAVATLLETARALTVSAPLQRDVIFLFSDAEEEGLLGASVFLQKHPWSQDAGLVLNFEARGSTGPVFMFETSSHTGWLMREFARAVSHPVTNSLMDEVYNTLPNDTDFTPYKDLQIPGFNFSYIDGASVYHAPIDRPGNLSLRSLQHHGDYALSLVRHFGDLPLHGGPGGDAVYFDLLGRYLIYYPASWSPVLAVLAVLVLIGVIWLGLRRGRLTWGGMGLGFLALLLAGVVSALIAWLGWQLARSLWPDTTQVLLADLYQTNTFWLGFVFLCLAGVSLLYAGFDRLLLRSGRRESLPAALDLWLGALSGWLLIAVATAFFFVGGSYVFLWPLMSGLLGAALLAARDLPSPWLRATWLAAAALPALLWVAPLVYMLHVALSLEMIIVPMIVMALLLGLLTPHLALLRQAFSGWLPAFSFVVGLVFFLYAGLAFRFDTAHPRPNMIVYGLDASAGEAYWMSFSDPDPWTSQFLPAGQVQSREPGPILPTTQGALPVSPAPVLDLPAPALDLLEDTRTQDLRTLRLKVLPPPGAANVRLYVVNGDPQAAVLDGERIAPFWQLEYWVPPPSGFEIAIDIRPSPGVPVKIIALSHSFGLPHIDGFSPQPRPDWMMPAPSEWSDSTVVSRTYDYGP